MPRRRIRQYEHQRNDYHSPAPNHQQESISAHPQHPVLQMQRQLGNRAVNQHLQHLQRSQNFALGSSVGAFAETAHGISTGDSAIQWLADLVDRVLTHLVAQNIYRPEFSSGMDIPATIQGQFTKDNWTLTVNPKMLGENPFRPASTMTREEQARILGIVYHEARHAEQYYKMAQFLAGKRIEAAEIAAQLEIPIEVAEDAFANPINPPSWQLGFQGVSMGFSPEYFELKQWYESVYGKYAIYNRAIYFLMQMYVDFSKWFNLLDDRRQFKAVRDDMDARIDLLKIEGIPEGLKAVKKALEENHFNFAYEEKMLEHVNIISPAVDNLVKKWNGKARVGKVKEFNVRHMMPLRAIIDPAYEDLLTEQDAHEIGEKAGSAFETYTPDTDDEEEE